MERIPILKMGEFLLVTIQIDMHDRLALTLQDDLTAQIVRHQTRGVLIDISALEMVDSFIGRMLGTIASMAHLLDAETVVVGMQPSVAITLVELGLSLKGIRTALDVEKGMTTLQAPSRNGKRDCSGAEQEQPPMRVVNAESMPLRSPEDIVAVRQAVEKGRFPWASDSSIRPNSSPPPANWPETRWTMAEGAPYPSKWSRIISAPRHSPRVRRPGPGIPNIEIALTDGFTTGKGMGLGLSGAKRLSHEFEIWSQPGEGTRVSILRWK